MNFIYKSKVGFWLRMAIASALSKSPAETTIKKRKLKLIPTSVKRMREKTATFWELE